MKELAFSGGTVMSLWISSRNWRESRPGSSCSVPAGVDPGKVSAASSMNATNRFGNNQIGTKLTETHLNSKDERKTQLIKIHTLIS